MSESMRECAPIADARLGAISFINTVPVYSAFTPPERVQLDYDVPSSLNRRILAGELDVSPVSSACYLRNQDKLVLLDDLSVSSPGAVESVIFISQEPLKTVLERLDTIQVPSDSETSIALLAHLIEQKTGQDPHARFAVYEAGTHAAVLQSQGNALVIGDNALLIQESGIPAGFHCYDLSSLWKAETGLPFVFAVWVARRDWAAANPEQLSSINRELCAARDRFFANADAYENGLALARSRCQLPDETLIRYYQSSLTYGLERPHLQALSLFAGILGVPSPNFALPQVATVS